MSAAKRQPWKGWFDIILTVFAFATFALEYYSLHRDWTGVLLAISLSVSALSVCRSVYRDRIA